MALQHRSGIQLTIYYHFVGDSLCYRAIRTGSQNRLCVDGYVSTRHHSSINTSKTFSNDVESRAGEPTNHIHKWLARRIGSDYFAPLLNKLTCDQMNGAIPQIICQTSNLRRRPVEQGEEGLDLTSAECGTHDLPLAVMSLAYTVISMSCNHKSSNGVLTLDRS